MNKTWLFISISLTLFGCQNDVAPKTELPIPDIKSLESILDQWHDAAARADSATYFNLLTDDAIFVGTDSSEVWNKAEFLTFASPYFAKRKAWTFKSLSRHIYSDSSQNTYMWFDEMLDTWMGPCRGSGVARWQDGKWKIKHYVLSVTVPNAKIKNFQEAMK